MAFEFRFTKEKDDYRYTAILDTSGDYFVIDEPHTNVPTVIPAYIVRWHFAVGAFKRLN